MKVLYSHICEDELKDIEDDVEIYDISGTYHDLIHAINEVHPGFQNLILDSHRDIRSSAAIYRDVFVDAEGRIFDTSNTQMIKNPNERINPEDTIIFSINNPERFCTLLEDTIKNPISKLNYINKERGDNIEKNYTSFLADITPPIRETIYKFQKGSCKISELKIDEKNALDIQFSNHNDPDNIFDKKASHLIPQPLTLAISRIWGIEDTNLYAHQEDALFYILGMLRHPQIIPYDALLLSIPTGGGKTEAFLIPIISHIFDAKCQESRQGSVVAPRVKAIITYPTKALANDQANRIVGILHEVNHKATPHQKVTVGILTGDTPSHGDWQLKKFNLIQVCPNCQSSSFDYIQNTDYETPIYAMRCRHCGSELNFIRLTRKDILSHPPDILITNVDMINYCLQSPEYRPIFTNPADIFVFDEVHLCESVFGCHTGHLLRRLEAASGKKPLYVGVSATIQNAEDLASILFDVDKNRLIYLNEKNRQYLTDQPDHNRYHFVMGPNEWNKGSYLTVMTSTLNTVDVIGHTLRDPHFRKTLVFCNYRQDTDDFIKYIQEQEERYVVPYRESVRNKLELDEPINSTEVNIASKVGGWWEYLSKKGSLYEPNLNIGWHRGGLEQKERLRSITRFSTCQPINWEGYMQELPIDIMVATKTLELGIDIGDVSNVFNLSSPLTVNEYVQRVGRGGRRKDASAFTIINPENPLDFYFLEHFEEYVLPEKRQYEDAPIIITNESIYKAHLYALILDYIAESLPINKQVIKVEDVTSLGIHQNGEVISLLKDPEHFAELVFERFFGIDVKDTNGSSQKMLKRYQRWFKREHELLKVGETNITKTQILEILVSKCNELRDKIRTENLSKYDDLSGLSSKESSLIPKMRGSGATCDIKLIRDRNDEVKDNVSRRRAITNMPIGGFASQGANTFKIESIERDPETESSIRRRLSTDRSAYEFFKNQFQEYFPDNITDIDVHTPTDIKVRYYPFRFYCPKCGKTYTKPLEDDRCQECFAEVRQVTQVYLCATCGEIYEPPVPRVCINPLHLEKERAFIASLHTKKPKYDIFRFKALPNLHWQCNECNAIFNFHNKHAIDLPKSFLNESIKQSSFESAVGIAKHFQYRPESIVSSIPKMKEYGNNWTRYKCDDGCGKYTIKAKNIPTVRSNVLEYINRRGEILEPITTDIGSLNFFDIDIIDLAREYSRRFYQGDNAIVKSSEIFKGKQYSYLGNAYRTHAMTLNFNSEIIDAFLSKEVVCLKTKCESCKQYCSIADGSSKLSEKTRPTIYLDTFEETKTPDIRRKWCALARNRECRFNECNPCPEFTRKEHLKYVLIHSLKHAIILSMPKYTGVNKNEIRGIVYPNDQTKPELIFIDTHEDGSGSVFLMRKNWDNIWKLSEELMINAATNRGTLMLPHYCERYNKDLCPVLGTKFYQFLHNSKLLR